MRTGSCGAGVSGKLAACPGSSGAGESTRLGSYQTAAGRSRTCLVVRKTSRTPCLRTGWMRGRALRDCYVGPFLCITPRKGFGLGSVVKRSLVGLQRVTTLTPCGLRLRRRMANGWGRTRRAARTNNRTPFYMTGRKVLSPVRAIAC